MIIRNTSNWLTMLFALKGTALRAVWIRLVVTISVAVAVTAVDHYVGNLRTGLTLAPFSLVGFAVSIFLGFRNNTSYDRFWEGRKLWGKLVNTSRSLCRQILTLTDADEATDRELVYTVLAYVHALRIHLRDIKDLRDLAPFLEDDQLAALVREDNRPVAIVQMLAQRLRTLYEEGKIHALHLTAIDSSLTDLLDIQGGCERIKSTPIPFSYNVLMHRIVAVYCFGLPFGLVGTVGLYTPLVVALVAYAFFGLDAVGEQIEEPFGYDANDLPLDQLCTTIEINLRQRLGEQELPKRQEGPVQT